MRIRFKHQKFQEDACNAVCDVFAGQPNESRKFLLDQGESSSNLRSLFGDTKTGWANPELHLREEDLLKNLRGIQKEHRILPSSKLETLTSKVEWDDGRKQSITKPVFTIEMETGTGKTYTYINNVRA